MSGDFDDVLATARAASVGRGRIDYLINRPEEGVHDPVDALSLDSAAGIAGDRWAKTAWVRLPDGGPDPRVQVSLTNTAVMRCFAGDAADAVFRCGDNLYTDLSLLEAHLSVGSILEIGQVQLEVSDIPNDACPKFAQRFGEDALEFVRRKEHESFRLRGIFCSIRQGGTIRVGDLINVTN